MSFIGNLFKSKKTQEKDDPDMSIVGDLMDELKRKKEAKTMGEIVPFRVGDLSPYRVYVVGGGIEYIRMLFDMSFGGAKGVADADIVLFTGGADVSPEFYGEKKHPKTYSDSIRDNREKGIYEECVKNNIPMVGICRGGQFLNVMNGGKMWQHVDGHATGDTHLLLQTSHTLGQDFKIDNLAPTVEVTSTHHQMMIPHPEKALVLGIAQESREKETDTKKTVMGTQYDDLDYEVLFYPETSCLCFQPHPEMASAPTECTEYFDQLMNDYIIPVCRPAKAA